MDFVLNNVMACAYHFLRHKSESRHNDGFAPNDNAAARGAAAVWKFAAGVVPTTATFLVPVKAAPFFPCFNRLTTKTAAAAVPGGGNLSFACHVHASMLLARMR